MNTIKNMNSERAKFAFGELVKITSEKSEFRSLARSLPTTVQANGLTAAVALLYAKKDKSPAHATMYEIISNRLHNTSKISKKDDLMGSIANAENQELRLATVEVMALLVWTKRFAEGMFKADE